ncbi:hypothetical protein C1645_831151 [Glomus cerebriforme]|uniref:Uncharacterized protein n=1 Tax=Glomus cerebriforme TaxID=658196 RepID=A0A397SJW6_9GLOM|nr:hypothetical protein C1645_831151 [Glomus cerebriforme]
MLFEFYLLTEQKTCYFPNCDTDVEIISDIDSRQDSQSSTSFLVRRMSNQLQINPPVIQEEDEEMNEVINGEEEITTQPDASSKKQVNESASGRSPKRIHTRSENRIYFDFNLKISNVEKQQNEDARHELIIVTPYYHFGEELEKHLIQYKHLEEHEAQKKVNNKVKDQLPKEVTKPTIQKKMERA